MFPKHLYITFYIYLLPQIICGKVPPMEIKHIKSDPKKIWRKLKPKCEHKVESVFELETTLTGDVMFTTCKCKSSFIFN